MADVIIPQEQVTPDNLLSLIDSQAAELQIPADVNEDSSVVMDSLEANQLMEDNALITGEELPDPSQVAVDVGQAQQGLNIRDKYASIFAEEDQLMKSLRVEAAMGDLTTSVEEKLTLLRNIRNLPQSDTFFEDYDTGIYSLHERNMNKQLVPQLQKLTVEEDAEIWAQMEWEGRMVSAIKFEQQGSLGPTRVSWFQTEKFKRAHPAAKYVATREQEYAGTSFIGLFAEEKDKQAYSEVWLDEFMYQTMMLPEFIHGLFDEETKEEMESFRALIDEKKKRGGFATELASNSAETFSLFVDPFTDGGAIVATGAIKALRLMKSAKKMSKIIGPATTMAMTRASHDSLVGYLKKLKTLDADKYEKLVVLSKSDDRIANKLSAAFIDVIADKPTDDILRLQESAAATMAVNAGVSGDRMATDNITEAVLAVNVPQVEGIEAIKKSIDADEVITITMIPDLPTSGVVNPTGEFGRQMENAKKISDTAAVQIENRMMQVPVTEFVEGMSHQKIYNRTLSAGPDATGWAGKSGSRLLGFTFNPRAMFKGIAKEELVIKPLLNIKEEQRLRRAFGKSLTKIFGNVKGNDAKLLEHVIQEGNDWGFHWNTVPGGFQRPGDPDSFIAASTKVIDSFTAYRRVHDDAGRILNDSMRIQMRDKGYKYFTESEEIAFPVHIRDPEKPLLDIDGNAISWGDENVKAGDSIWYFSKKGERGGAGEHIVLTKEQVETSLHNIPDTYNPLNSVEGDYMHVKYTDDFIITEVQLDDAGNIIGAKKVATARTNVEAAKFTTKFANPEKNIFYIADRIDGPTTDVITSADMFDNQFRMTDPQFNQFLKALEEGGKPQEFIQALKDSRRRYGYKAQPYMKQRGKRLISAKTAAIEEEILIGEQAPILQSAEAAAYYMAKVSRYTANAPYNDKMLKTFLDSYGRFLIDPDDAFSPIKSVREVGFKQHQEIAAYQRQMRNIVNRPAKIDELLNAARQAAVDKVELVDNKYVSTVGRALEKIIPTTRTAGMAVKGLTRQALMGVGAVIQAPLQFSTSYINSMLISSGGALVRGDLKQALNVAAKTQTDFVEVLLPIATKGERKLTKAGKETNDLIIRSGILDGIDLEAFGSNLQDPRNIHSISTGTLQKIGNAVSGWALWGEKGGQIFGWLAARREIESMIKAGKHPVLTMADLTKKTDDFVDTITARGALLSHNMSRANRPGMATGDILSTVTMFKRFGFDQAGLMFNLGKELKKSEVFAIWAGTIGAFGLRGVPGYTDASVLAEKIENLFSEVPDADGKWLYEVPLAATKTVVDAANRLGLPAPEARDLFLALQQGLPSALTDGQIALAPRMAVDGLFTSFTQGASWDENMLGASYSVTKKVLKQSKLTARIMFEAIEEYGVTSIPGETLGAAGREAIKPFVGVEKIRQAVKAYATGVIRSSTGQILKDNATFEDVLVLSLGDTPGDIRMIQEYRSMMFRRKATMRSWLKSVAKQAASLGVESPDTADLFIDNIQAQLEKAGYARVGIIFQQQAIREKMKLEMPVDQKVLFDSIIDPLVDEQMQEILGLIQRK